MARSVVLSSAGTASIALDPVPRSNTIQLVNSGVLGTSGAVQVDWSLDDPSIYGGPTTTWSLLSSGAALLSSNVTTLVWQVLSPVGQVRINSTALSTSTGPTTFTLKVLQSVAG